MPLNFDRFTAEEYIPAGTYLVEKKPGKILTALLGSCVGVALSDRIAKIGGMIHLLLPEPNDPNSPWQAEMYASTGLPIFLGQLYTAGAEKSRLVAVVAGGSFTGQVSDLDLDLDIGGRTTDVVMKILRAENITIISSDTGGYYGSKLMLDTSTWETKINPTFPEKYKPSKTLKLPSDDEIEQAISTTRPVPQIALKIIRLLRQGNYDIKTLVETVSRDQVIAARVLQLSNSALFGTRQLDSIDRALVLLGENHLLELVLASSLESYFTQREGGYSLRRGGLFIHSVGVANVAREIAIYSTGVDSGLAYTAGLLHDIGKVVLDHFVSGVEPLFYQPIPDQPKDFIELEKKLLGIDHQEVGKRLADRWRLSKSLCAAIEFHSTPENAPLKYARLVHCIYLANLLTSWFQAGTELEQFDTDNLPDRLAVLGLSSKDIQKVISRIPWQNVYD